MMSTIYGLLAAHGQKVGETGRPEVEVDLGCELARIADRHSEQQPALAFGEVSRRAPDGPISGSVRTWPVRSASAFRRAPCASALPWIEARRSPASANPSASAAARRTTTVRRHAVTMRASAAGSIAASTAGRNTPASTTPADSAPAMTKRRAAPTDGRSTSDRDVGLEGVELLLADARDLHQVL